MPDLGVEPVIIEDQLIDHLATPDGAIALWRERFDPRLINDKDKPVRDLLVFVLDWINKHHLPPDPSVLVAEFGYDFQEPTTPVEYVIGEFRNRYRRTQAQEAATKVARLVNEDSDEAVRTALAEFGRIRSETMSRRYEGTTKDIVGRVDDFYRRVEEGVLAGTTFGFDEVDKLLGGLRLGGLYCVVGRPKRYKSWFLLFSAYKAWVEGQNVDFYTLEMTIEEMQDRFLCMVSGVNYGEFMQYRGGKGISSSVPKPMADALDWAKTVVTERDNIVRFLRPPLGQRTVQSLRQMTGESPMPVAAIYIDQLKFIEATRHAAIDQRWREVEFVMEDLKDAADDFPIYFACQFNREAAGLTEMADLSKIGLSDSIGQTCDMVLGLYANKDMAGQRLIEFGVVEARAFEHVSFEIKVSLEGEHYLKFLNRKES